MSKATFLWILDLLDDFLIFLTTSCATAVIENCICNAFVFSGDNWLIAVDVGQWDSWVASRLLLVGMVDLWDLSKDWHVCHVRCS